MKMYSFKPVYYNLVMAVKNIHHISLGKLYLASVRKGCRKACSASGRMVGSISSKVLKYCKKVLDEVIEERVIGTQSCFEHSCLWNENLVIFLILNIYEILLQEVIIDECTLVEHPFRPRPRDTLDTS
jgi:hypothetical protein